jgi:hypothetical protein
MDTLSGRPAAPSHAPGNQHERDHQKRRPDGQNKDHPKAGVNNAVVASKTSHGNIYGKIRGKIHAKIHAKIHGNLVQ